MPNQEKETTVPAGLFVQWLAQSGKRQAEAARLLSTSDQVINNWKRRGIPKGRIEDVARLMRITYDQYVSDPAGTKHWQFSSDDGAGAARTTLADRARKAREMAGMSKGELAKALGVSPSEVTQWESGETTWLAGQNLMRAAAAMSCDPQWLATGRGGDAPRPLVVSEMSSHGGYRTDTPYGPCIVVPVYNAIGSMGPGAALVERDTVIGGMQLSERWVSRNLPGISSVGNLSVISAIGDSMSPTFNDGDILLVDKGVFDLKMDAVYVLAKNDELFIKRVHRKLGGGVVIKSDNPLHGEEHIDNPESVGLQILGRVVWAWNGKRL